MSTAETTTSPLSQFNIKFPIFTDHGYPVCSTTDPEMFFPLKGNAGKTQNLLNTAKKMCKTCPYIDPCLEWAVVYHENGVWGGTTENERREIRRRWKRSGKII